jgi:hypothetical protein
MSETSNERTFEDTVLLINEKYINLLNELIEKFKYHEELIGPLQYDLKLTNEKLVENKNQVLDTITENLLFCFEQIIDNNSDYFIYQKDKIKKKNGKTYKNKLPKIGNKTLLKKVLKELDSNDIEKLFKNIFDMFSLLIRKDDEKNVFISEYDNYVKENYCENKNFSKMIMVLDNVDSLLNSKMDEVEQEQENENDESDDSEEDTKKKSKGDNKKKKNKSKKEQKLGADFMKGVENTKIGQLARNISQKINIDDFPELTDPTKLISSLTNSNPEQDGGGLQNLLKFVIGEVEDAFKNKDLNEKDLVNEAQNMMGQFSNMSGFDPMSLLGGNNGINMDQFANIFSTLGKK